MLSTQITHVLYKHDFVGCAQVREHLNSRSSSGSDNHNWPRAWDIYFSANNKNGTHNNIDAKESSANNLLLLVQGVFEAQINVSSKNSVVNFLQ